MVAALEEKKIQTRMLFAGNMTRQPALTQLAAQAKAEGRPAPSRVVGSLANTDEIMNRTLWFGVYPGIAPGMREYAAEVLTEFVRRLPRGPK